MLNVGINPPLSSEWGELSDFLKASFYEVDRHGKVPENGKTVIAPLTEANLEALANWQSPFEHSGPETMAPTLSAMIQSGAFGTVIDAGLAVADRAANALGAPRPSAILGDEVDKYKSQLEGRAGITKLNSTQIYTGSPPLKIHVSALFRAWNDPIQEVKRPISQLMMWALPQELAPDGGILTRLANRAAGKRDDSAINDILPSRAPALIAMHYKKITYLPLVIETIELPIGANVTELGDYVEMEVKMTLASLTALDRHDWLKMQQG
jgi:hypothetical protein